MMLATLSHRAASPMRALTFALIISLAAFAAFLVDAAPARAQQVSYPDAPAYPNDQYNGGAPYAVTIVMPSNYPQVTIDFSGAEPVDPSQSQVLTTWGPISGVALVPVDPGNGFGVTYDPGIQPPTNPAGSAGGTLTDCTALTCTYTAPYAGWWGVETFMTSVTGRICYASDSSGGVCPGVGGSRWVALQVTVYPPPPTDYDGTINTGYGQAATVTLPISGVLSSAWINSGPSHGSVSISGQQVTYAPAGGFYGSDSFTYQSNGPGGNGNVATIYVNVARPPPPSTAGASINTPYMTAASVNLPASGLVDSYGITVAPAHGSLSVSGSSATYTPSSGFWGADSFVFNASGPGGVSNTSTVSINVGLPPPPAPQNNTLTVPYNSAGSIGLTANGVITSYALAGRPSHGAVSLSGSTATYTPVAGYIGRDSFTFTVAGPGGNGAGTISVTVDPPPPPVVYSAPLTCAYQTVCTVTLTTTGITSSITLKDPPGNGTCSISGDTLTYTPAWGAVGSDSCSYVASGPGGTSAPATLYITNEPPPLPDPGGSVGAAETVNPDGTVTAICAAGQSATFPFLPGPPIGTGYDPNWCAEQALTIAQQALQIQNQLSAIANLQSQVAAAQKQLQGLGSDSTTATLQTVNGELVRVLQQATGIGFNTLGAGQAFSTAYPSTATTAGFNGAQLATALNNWQSNTAAALQNSVAVQNQIAQQQGQVTGAIQNAVAASNAAPGATASTQATNQILAAVSTQLTQLQDILIASSQAYDLAQASAGQAAATAAAASAQTQGQTMTTLTAPTGVSDTSSL